MITRVPFSFAVGTVHERIVTPQLTTRQELLRTKNATVLQIPNLAMCTTAN